MENQRKVITMGALGKYDNLRPQVKPVKATYEEMTEMRDQGKLIPGQYYQITDYVTTVSTTPDPNTGMVMVRSAGHQFDLLVRADAADTLSETAWAVQHDGDTYFQNARLEAWQLKYTLDNDSNRYDWADTEQGKGVIYEMQDEWGNSLPYDFKNVQFLRFPIMGQSHLYVNSGYPTEMDDDGYVTDVIGAKLTINTLNPTDLQRLRKLGAYLHPFMGYYSEQYIYDDGYTDSWDGLELEDGGTRMFACVTDNYESYGILAEVDKTKAVWCHTFGKLTAFTAGETEDVTLTGRAIDFKMSPCIDIYGKEFLSYNVMVSNQNIMYQYVKITGVFNRNTISERISNVSISGDFQYSSISGAISKVSISGAIDSVSISGAISKVSISGDFQYSSISGAIDRVSISGAFRYSSISGVFQYSSISGHIFNVSISGDFQYSSISGGVIYTTIKAECCYLSLPALENVTIVGTLPYGDGWDDLLEVPFTAQNYEQLITCDDNDEIVVKALYNI